MLMDQVDTLHVGRYWSEVLCGTITNHLAQGHGLRNFVFKSLARLHEVQRAIVVTSVICVPVPVPVPITLRQTFLEVHSLAATYDREFKLDHRYLGGLGFITCYRTPGSMPGDWAGD